MIVAARASGLSPFAHAVDDTGALCGARPQGKWRMVKRMPVNCPRCLLRMGAERYALCEVPTASTRSPIHIRRVGMEGVSKSGSSMGAMTLCNLGVGWDLSELRSSAELEGPASYLQRFCSPCLRVYSNPALASVRDQILVAQR